MTAELELKPPVAWITLQRPTQMNALDRTTLAALEVRLKAVGSDDAIRVVVLTGAGVAFCAGADLKSAVSPARPGETDFLDQVTQVFGLLRQLQKPVIAAVNGLAMAGGLELALCCDLIVAAESARLGDAHANFGVLPGGGGTAILPRRLPLNVAKELLFTGNSLSAARMAALGLVNQVVPDDELLASVQDLAQLIAEKSPLVIASMKRVSNATADLSENEALHMELQELRDHMQSRDFAEGLSAFRDKRKPEFIGR